VGRPTGNIAIVGVGASGAVNAGIAITDPNEAKSIFGDGTDLQRAIALAYEQTPGPSLIYGVRLAATASAADLTAALAVVESLDSQLVVLANTPLNTGNTASVTALRNHVDSVSKLGGEGKERMGVTMLAKGSTDTSVVTGSLVNERMIYIAHKSDQDAAAAVAGTIAGYPPHVSMLLKRVVITSQPFTSAEIDTINGQEVAFQIPPKGPAGKGVNWLVDPDLIPGPGMYLGEGYTGDPAGKKFIDIVRTIDDVSFQLKARLIRAIGSVRISRSGLRALIVQLEAVLDPLVQGEVIESYTITIPVLNLLDKDPATLSDSQLQAIKKAQDERLVQVLIAVDYAGAIHRLEITLKFE
jgi:hypothetical protein